MRDFPIYSRLGFNARNNLGQVLKFKKIQNYILKLSLLLYSSNFGLKKA